MTRRIPQRANGRATVEAIFEATARILEADGRTGLNTNRIAQVAGVSIGALYGYFPDKQSILEAMALRELDSSRDQVGAALESLTPGDDPVQVAVATLIDVYARRGPVRRILMETLFAMGQTEIQARPVSEIANLLAANWAALAPSGQALPDGMALFVLTRAVDGVIRAGAYEGLIANDRAGFEATVVAMIRRMLGWSHVGK